MLFPTRTRPGRGFARERGAEARRSASGLCHTLHADTWGGIIVGSTSNARKEGTQGGIERVAMLWIGMQSLHRSSYAPHGALCKRHLCVNGAIRPHRGGIMPDMQVFFADCLACRTKIEVPKH